MKRFETLRQDNTLNTSPDYLHGGISCPVDTQRKILKGKGRLMNQYGANLPVKPIRRERPRPTAPIFFMVAILTFWWGFRTKTTLEGLRYFRGGYFMNIEPEEVE